MTANLIETFSEAVKLDVADKGDLAIDTILHVFNDACWALRWDDMDEVFSRAPADTPVRTTMALLSITRPAKNHLPNRDKFYLAALEHLKLIGRDADKLLGGLR